MSKPEIIGSSRSTYTRVVRMVCEEKGIDHTLTEVALGAPELGLIHPFGRMPVLRHGDVALFLDDPETRPTDVHTTVDGDHGRIETRTCAVSTDIGWLQEVHDWPGLNAIGKVIRTRETSAKVTTETAYYLLSTPLSAERFGHVVRSHWAVENSLHWCLDVIMNEDNARNRLDNGPYNLAILRHMALNLIRKEPSKGSLRVKIKRAGWKDAYLAQVLAQI